MKTRAAVLFGVGREWQIEEIDLEPPKAGEVLVKLAAAGLCHSDDHMVTGDLVPPPEMLAAAGMESPFPIVGGHEGAGVVVAVGPGVTTVNPGDHVATSFIPACGRCRWCISGRSALCDMGSQLFSKGMVTDGTPRHFFRGEPLLAMTKLGTFSEHTVVAESSVVKIDPDVPLACAALVSCGVATGWGSAVNRAGVRPGDMVVVIGCGGIGMNAIQGARLAGAQVLVGVDPVEFKQKAALDFGATHVVASTAEALDLVGDLSGGQMAERVILTPSVMDDELLFGALQLTGKDGTCVVTAMPPLMQTHWNLSLFELVLWNKELKGSLFGSGSPRREIPNLLSLYKTGQLKLDELITKSYRLDEINQGYSDMRDGKNIRGVITFDTP